MAPMAVQIPLDFLMRSSARLCRASGAYHFQGLV